jgi:hypothetical protein
MRATVRRFHSPDLQDLAVDKPADPEKFGMLVQMLVGPADGPGEESFDVLVCIPSRLADLVEKGPIIARHHLVVSRWNWKEIEGFLRAQVARCEAETWAEIGNCIARVDQWEFEELLRPAKLPSRVQF